VAAYGISKAQTPLYRSQATYGVFFNRIDTGANSFAASLFNGYINTVYQPDQLQAISDQLGLDRSGQELMQYVRLQSQPDNGQIIIEADYFDPAHAQALAAAVGENLNAVVAELNRNNTSQDKVFLRRSQSALAAWKAKPNTKINVVAAALLGAVLAILLSFVLEYLDDTLKTPADVERFAGLTTIGTIPALAARGGQRVLLRPRSMRASQ
jgi:capsular polysaccharide biosynthesis protein